MKKSLGNILLNVVIGKVEKYYPQRDEKKASKEICDVILQKFSKLTGEELGSCLSNVKIDKKEKCLFVTFRFDNAFQRESNYKKISKILSERNMVKQNRG